MGEKVNELGLPVHITAQLLRDVAKIPNAPLGEACQKLMRAAADDLDRLREAAETLVNQIDFVKGSDEYRVVWTENYLRNGNYEGPRFFAQLEQLRAALHPESPQGVSNET